MMVSVADGRVANPGAWRALRPGQEPGAAAASGEVIHRRPQRVERPGASVATGMGS